MDDLIKMERNFQNCKDTLPTHVVFVWNMNKNGDHKNPGHMSSEVIMFKLIKSIYIFRMSQLPSFDRWKQENHKWRKQGL